MEPRKAFAFSAPPSVLPPGEGRRAKQASRDLLPLVQATERQRLTRELHDSTSQLLVAAQLMTGRLKRTLSDDDALVIVDELQDLMTEVQQEIRSISYLSQPPALEKLSFTQAVKTLVEGFGRRSGLIVSMQVVGSHATEWPEAGAALYRIVQEGLSNILRHAQATTASVSVIVRGNMTHVVIRDDGRGISRAAEPGVGLSGMRVRLAELGGRLTVRSLFPGTAIIASLATGTCRRLA